MGGGITKGMVSDWERSKSVPHPSNVGRLAEWMDMTVRRIDELAEDAERPEGFRTENVDEMTDQLAVRLDDIEREIQRLAAENIEMQRVIGQLSTAVAVAATEMLRWRKENGED